MIELARGVRYPRKIYALDSNLDKTGSTRQSFPTRATRQLREVTDDWNKVRVFIDPLTCNLCRDS